MNAVRATCLVLLAAFALGCDQVGAPLVDRQRLRPPPIPRLKCTVPPPCEPPEQVEHVASAVHAVDLGTCGGIAAADCPAFGSIEAGASGIANAGSDEFVDDDADGGMSDGEGSERFGRQCPGMQAQPLIESLACATLTSADASLPAAALKPAWSDANVRLESSTARTLVLEHAQLRNVFVELRGPITVRIERADQLEQVRVRGVATAAGAPRLVLEDVTAKGLLIGDVSQSFDGTVSVRNGSFEDLQLMADEVAFESVKLTGAQLEARVLNMADFDITDAAIEANRALMSAGKLDGAQLLRCGELAMISSRVLNSVLGPCDQPVRLFDVFLLSSTIDGPFEIDGGKFEHLRVGTRAPTALQMWDGSLVSSSLCSQVEQLTLAGHSQVRCGLCDPFDRPEGSICELPIAETKLELNLCPPLEADLPRCASPQPIRHRPFDPSGS